MSPPMLIVLSPAKRLDFSQPDPTLPASDRRFMDDTSALWRTARRQTRADLRRLMSISEDLARLNHERFRTFDPETTEGVQAAFAFAGDVYEGLKARELDTAGLDWAQQHLRILSGFYGVLRPLDRIQPYRLEMGVRLKTRRGQTLYDFWGDRLSRTLNADADGHADPTLVNLASQEYFGAVDTQALGLPVVTPQFREVRDGESRIIAFFAKRARGAMARYAVDHRLERAEDLKDFDRDGYRFDASTSTETDWVFARPGKS